MPATSPEQKTAACLALAMKRGDMKMTPGTAAANMMKMSEQDLVDMCGTKVKPAKK